MKKIVTRAQAPTQKRNAALLNPTPQTTVGVFRQPWDTRAAIYRGDREATLGSITSAIATDLGDVTRFRVQALALGTGEDVTDSNPLAYALNVQPSLQMTASVFWQSCALSLLYAGEAYILQVGNTLTPLVGGNVEILIPSRDALAADGSPILIAGFRVRNASGVITGEYGPDGRATGAGAIPGSRLYRAWFPHPESFLRANPPVGTAQVPAEVSFQLRQATKSILVNDGMPAGIVTVNGDIDDESLQELERRVNNRLADPNRKGRTLVVDQELSYEALGNTVLNGDWVVVAKSLREELFSVFRVPGSVLGQVGGMTYENQNVAQRTYRTQVLMPLRQMILDALNTGARALGYTLETEIVDGSDLDELQKADQELKQAQKVAALAQLGVATVDELREMVGLPPIPGGDQLAAAPVPVPQASREAPPFEVRASRPRINADRYSARFDDLAGTLEGDFAEFAQRFHARLYRNIVGALRRRAQRAVGDKPLPPVNADDLLDVAGRTRELADDLLVEFTTMGTATVEFVAAELDIEPADLERVTWRQLLDRRVSRLVEGITDGGEVVYRGWVAEIHADLSTALVEAYEAGESVDGAAGRIAQLLDVDPANPAAVGDRAMRIARTETIGLMNESARQQMAESGVVTAKRWYSIGDSRTRASHSALNGVEVPFTAKFTVGGFEADGPHDPGLPAREVVQCRCRLIPVV